MVGARGFEPPASASRTLRSTRLSHAPKNSGRGDRTRTCNQRFWRPLRYQLRHTPVLAEGLGIEPRRPKGRQFSKLLRYHSGTLPCPAVLGRQPSTSLLSLGALPLLSDFPAMVQTRISCSTPRGASSPRCGDARDRTGAVSEARTRSPHLGKVVRCQLRHYRVGANQPLVRLPSLELGVSRLEGGRDANYATAAWCPRKDSNLQPRD